MSNGIHHDGQFVICGGSVQYWIGTNAKTLTGAKAIASKTYQAAVGGKIEVAVFHAAQECYEVVAVGTATTLGKTPDQPCGPSGPLSLRAS